MMMTMSSQQLKLGPHCSRNGDLQSSSKPSARLPWRGVLPGRGWTSRTPHGGLGSLSEESSEEEEEEESAADQPAEEPEDDSPEQVRRVEREPSDEVTDAVREVQRQAGLREELRGVERTWHRVLVEPGHR